MKFYGRMLISPIHKPPFEVLAHWEYKDGVWYGNGESYPAEICRLIQTEPQELIPENDTQELWEQNGRIKALLAYAELREEMTVGEIKAILGGCYGKGSVIHEE